MRPAAMPRSTTASASPSTARARRPSWRSPTSRWRRVTSVVQASASIRCAGRTTCRAPATWARSRTSFPAIATSRTIATRTMFETMWGATLSPEPGLRIPNMLDAAVEGCVQGDLHPGRGHPAVRSRYPPRRGRPRGDGMRGRARPVPQRDRQLRACVSAGLDVPREGRHVHERRAPHPARPPRDDAEERRLCRLGGHAAHRQGRRARLELYASEPGDGRDRRADADVRGRELRQDRSHGLGAVAVQRRQSDGLAGHARDHFRARQGQVHDDRVRADRRADGAALPAAADDGPHPLAIQCRRADAADGERHLA